MLNAFSSKVDARRFNLLSEKKLMLPQDDLILYNKILDSKDVGILIDILVIIFFLYYLVY